MDLNRGIRDPAFLPSITRYLMLFTPEWLKKNVVKLYGILVKLYLSITIAVIKYHDKRNLRRKRFVLLNIPPYSSSAKEVRTGTQVGQ